MSFSANLILQQLEQEIEAIGNTAALETAIHEIVQSETPLTTTIGQLHAFRQALGAETFNALAPNPNFHKFLNAWIEEQRITITKQLATTVKSLLPPTSELTTEEIANAFLEFIRQQLRIDALLNQD